jgi:decaprenyl-phosphate phosphoribosyltransferase
VTVRALVELTRPRQWVKNALVIAAPVAAGVIDERGPLVRTAVTFVAFCSVSAGAYCWNDAVDAAADRRHPTKRRRPVARGAVAVSTARTLGVVLTMAGIVTAFAARWQAGVVVAVYVALTATYTLWWKHVAVLDLLAVAGGFVLRAMAGARAADVRASTWFVLCVSFASLVIVTGKRYAELRELGDRGGGLRTTLAAYTPAALRTALTVAAAAMLAAYAAWAFELDGGDSAAIGRLTIVPVTIALWRYVTVVEDGHGAAPEEIFLADRPLQLIGAVWIVAFAVAVYA